MKRVLPPFIAVLLFTAVQSATAATLTPTATLTNTSPLPPEQAGTYLSVSTDPKLPEAIPATGFVVDLFVSAINPNGYTLFDGIGYLYFEDEPIRGITIFPNRTYRITVSDSDQGCTIGPVPQLFPIHMPLVRR